MERHLTSVWVTTMTPAFIAVAVVALIALVPRDQRLDALKSVTEAITQMATRHNPRELRGSRSSVQRRRPPKKVDTTQV
jgi:hypothetical protein